MTWCNLVAFCLWLWLLSLFPENGRVPSYEVASILPKPSMPLLLIPIHLLIPYSKWNVYPRFFAFGIGFWSPDMKRPFVIPPYHAPTHDLDALFSVLFQIIRVPLLILRTPYQR